MQLDTGTQESVMPSGGSGVTELRKAHTSCSTEFCGHDARAGGIRAKNQQDHDRTPLARLSRYIMGF
jgi:hypothetical protein